MADASYKPPEQGGALQFLDIIFLIAAIFGTMLLPVWLKLAGAATETTKIDNPTWEKLGQTAAQAAQWTALGKDPASAHDIIQTRFNYTIDYTTLIAVAVVLFLYFFLLFRFSDSEYREVLAEKFPDKK
jgi:predicted PurR-regulated permease PerM